MVLVFCVALVLFVGWVWAGSVRGSRLSWDLLGAVVCGGGCVALVRTVLCCVRGCG